MIEPQCVLYINQFGKNYDDLPYMEDAKEIVDGTIYRSKQNERNVYIYHSSNKQWDAFVWSYA
jgi:hypothetical protein